MLALGSNKDPKLSFLPSLHFTDAVTEAPRVSWLAQDHAGQLAPTRLPRSPGAGVLGPPWGHPPWRSAALKGRRGTRRMLRGCGLYGREAHCLLAPLPARARDPLGERVTFSPPVLGWGGRSCRSSAAIREHLLCAVRGPGPPTAQGLSALLWEPAGSSCMAPGPTQPRFQGPYSLLTAWAEREPLPSRPV